MGEREVLPYCSWGSERPWPEKYIAYANRSRHVFEYELIAIQAAMVSFESVTIIVAMVADCVIV